MAAAAADRVPVAARSWASAVAAPGLAALLAVTATLHFVTPATFDALIPTALTPAALPGGARFWTLASGVAELVVAATIALPRSRGLGATAAAVLFVAVFPGNVKMAIDWSDRSLPDQLIAYGRLPLQIPLILWSLSVRRAARARGARAAGARVTGARVSRAGRSTGSRRDRDG